MKVFAKAFKTSLPVLTGYLAIGIAYGLLLTGAGYPFWLAPLSGILMYTGAGQYAAVGLFAGGAGLLKNLFVQAALAVRHIAYGFSMHTRYAGSGAAKPYLIYALTDETFALLASAKLDGMDKKTQTRYQFFVSLLDQSYWVAGSFFGAAMGALLPFDMEGITFSLTALFIVLALEQYIGLFKRKG